MTIPLAASPSQLTPGLYLSVDLLAGAASPGTGALKVALLSPKGTAGDLTVDTELRRIYGADDAATAFGTGTPGHLAAKKLYQQYPSAIVDVAAPTAGSGTGTLGITFSGAPGTDGNVVDVDIHGVEFEVSWLYGEAASDLKTKLINAIAARTQLLAVTGADGGGGLCTVTAKGAGNIYEDIKCRVKLRNTATGTEAVAGATTHTALSGATTDPDFTSILALLAGTEYHFIVPCLSNADATNVGTSNNVDKTYLHIAAYNEGLGAKLQQYVVGVTSSVAAGVASSVHANSGNNATFGDMIVCIGGRDLPCEYAAREAGGRLAAISLDPAANRIGELFDDMAGAFDKIADKPTLAESESALGGGCSLISYTEQDVPVLVRSVTTHSQDSSGNADRRLLDTQNVDAAYVIARDLRSALPAQFPQAKITPDTEANEEPPPAGVIEERDIKAFIVSRLRFWERRGVVTRASVDAAIADGTLIVQVNETDATQVDIVVPFKVVPPLAKFGTTVQRVPA